MLYLVVVRIVFEISDPPPVEAVEGKETKVILDEFVFYHNADTNNFCLGMLVLMFF